MQNLQTISTNKQLRDELSEVLERVAIGQQEFVVTKFGRRKAKLGPVGATDTKQKTAKKTKKYSLLNHPARGMTGI